MAQIPRAESGLDCPLWKKDVSEVCHKCPLWVQLRGKHPQSEEAIDRWGCAIGWLPMLMIESAQQTRQAGAAIESFRNEMLHANERTLALMTEPMREIPNASHDQRS